MKQKRAARVERRRQLVEINLIADPKTGPKILARRGCALFGSAALLAVSAAVFVGLH